MAKLAAPKKPTAKAAPKKPTSRSKTGNSECSAAASNWQLSIRGKAALDPDTYQTLAKCRALSSTKKKADAYGRTGKLSDMGAAALSARADKRFSQGLVTQKSRTDRLNLLLKQRSERGKLAAPKLAPGRGTEERKQLASDIRTLRNVERGNAPIEAAKSVRPFNDKYTELKEKAQGYAPSQRPDIAKLWETSQPSARGIAAGNRDRFTIIDQVYRSGKLSSGSTQEQVAAAIESQRQQNALSTANYRRMEISSRVAGKAYRGEAESALEQIRKQSASPVLKSGPVKVGKLAPGRGTEERKRTAEYILETRKQIAKKSKLIDRNLAKSNRTGYSSQSIAKNVSDKERFAWNLASMRQHAKKLTGTANKLSRYSLGGKLAPGRGKDAPEYRDRLEKLIGKVQERSKRYEMSQVDNARVPLRAFQERGKELRTGTLLRLKDAHSALVFPRPQDNPKPRKSKMEFETKYYDQEGRFHRSELVHMHSEYVGITRVQGKLRSGYQVIDAKTGMGIPNRFVKTAKEAKRIATALDYLTRRAPIKSGKERTLSAAVSDDKYRSVVKSIFLKRMQER